MTGAPPNKTRPRVAVLTVSTSRAHKGGDDQSGDALAELVQELGGELVERALVADDRAEIETRLLRWTDGVECDLIFTTGGTGFSPSDVTPEATAAVIERAAPGIAEAMRGVSADHTRYWMLSRATAGIRGSTLIVNFPGSPKAIGETAAVLVPVLPHAVSLLRGALTSHSS
jgi:molybdenum cofactor synthesis domain-containing protein